MPTEKEKPAAGAERRQERKLYAGGNPRFDERTPDGRPAQAKKLHAGGNPRFDERTATKPETREV